MMCKLSNKKGVTIQDFPLLDSSLPTAVRQVWSGCGLCRRRRHSPHPLQTWVSRRRRREVLNSYLYSTDLSSCTNGPLMVFTLIASFLALCYTALEDWKGVFYYET